MDYTAVYNYIETGLWTVYAVVLVVAAARTRTHVDASLRDANTNLGETRPHEGTVRRRRILLIAATGFLAFAASDLIEAQTGAWWRPWWLVVLKGSCLATFLGCFIAWRKAQAREP